MASLGYGLGLGRFLPLTVFSLSSPFVFRVIAFIYDVRVMGGSLVSVCCPAVLLSLLSGLYRVHGLRVSSLFVTLFADSSCLLFLFRKCLLLLSLFCFLSLLFHHTSFVFIFGLLANLYPLLACLIRAAILNFSFRLRLFTSRCYIIGSPD